MQNVLFSWVPRKGAAVLRGGKSSDAMDLLQLCFHDTPLTRRSHGRLASSHLGSCSRVKFRWGSHKGSQLAAQPYAVWLCVQIGQVSTQAGHVPHCYVQRFAQSWSSLVLNASMLGEQCQRDASTVQLQWVPRQAQFESNCHWSAPRQWLHCEVRACKIANRRLK